MPKHWIRIEHGWNPHPDVYGFQEEIYRIVTEADGGLDELLWKPDSRDWHVIVHATRATDLDRILDGLDGGGFKPELLERDLSTPEEASIRLASST